MNLIKYELKKIIFKKYIVIALILFIISNIIKINVDYRKINMPNDNFNKAYWKVHEKVQGELNNEKISFVINNYKKALKIVESGNFETKKEDPNTYTGYIYGDMNLFKKVYDSMDYCYNYNKNMEDYIKFAEGNIEFFKEKSNTYEALKNKNIKATYSNRKISSFYDTDGFYNYFTYDFSSLLILMLIILGISPVFSKEKECEMDLLIKTSKKGKFKIINAKVVASFIYVILINLIFFLTDIITFSATFKLFGFSNKLYSIKEFIFTPLNISILNYFILYMILKIVGFLTITMLILVLSSLSSKSYLTFIFSATSIIVLIFSSYNYNNTFLNSLNPIFMLVNRNLFLNYEVIRIFNHPILTGMAYTVVNIALILISILVVNNIYSNNIWINVNFSRLNRKEVIESEII
ncbi:ABC transporter permease [Hathewaya massiliensis]|uniref:ABC transporter permease n=1 Tax=Hathewaya massiliensis TaxID=1964382 RepID=UPI001158A204|nr:ABC transporter permease [Hathewaya massiliensis]